MRFYRLSIGSRFIILIEDVIDASEKLSRLKSENVKKLESIDTSMHI